MNSLKGDFAQKILNNRVAEIGLISSFLKYESLIGELKNQYSRLTEFIDDIAFLS